MKRPSLSIPAILRWADLHRERTGGWPKVLSGPVVGGPGGLTWGQIDHALRSGHRSLPGGDSLARLLARERGRRHNYGRPPLTAEAILGWARRFHEQTGQWPRVRSGTLALPAGENWAAVNNALQQGLRGLPGGDSLSRLLRRRFDWRDAKGPGAGRRRNVKVRRQAARLRKAGHTLPEIARRLGVSKQAVYQLLHPEKRRQKRK